VENSDHHNLTFRPDTHKLSDKAAKVQGQSGWVAGFVEESVRKPFQASPLFPVGVNHKKRRNRS
jgi:hypothetical protein